MWWEESHKFFFQYSYLIDSACHQDPYTCSVGTPSRMPSNPSSATNPLAYAKCPYCDKSFHTHGGGIANHIWRSPFCCRKKHQWLKSLVAKVRSVAIPGTQHHIPAPSLPSKVSLEHSNGAPNTQQDFQDSFLDGLDNWLGQLNGRICTTTVLHCVIKRMLASSFLVTKKLYGSTFRAMSNLEPHTHLGNQKLS